MSKCDMKNLAKTTIERAVESQRNLTDIEKMRCIAVAAVGIATLTAIGVCTKLCAMRRKIKKCEKRLDDLESLCTDPNN